MEPGAELPIELANRESRDDPSRPSQKSPFYLRSTAARWWPCRKTLRGEIELHIHILESPEFAQLRVECFIDGFLDAEYHPTAMPSICHRSAIEPGDLRWRTNALLDSFAHRFVRFNIHADTTAHRLRRDCHST